MALGGWGRVVVGLVWPPGAGREVKWILTALHAVRPPPSSSSSNPSVVGRFKVALHSLRQEEEEEEGKGGCEGDEAGVGDRLKPSPKEYGFI